ncbi:hypothetical protein EVAR_16269_1 [Eumeta japonica]|uniref:Uncharacterized protein n=1 Tax=Eumeta variegata TaxID=151549 RepID=A0A4C1U5Y6_EUMVA|nr:hypothetical protein EVAR_16269_1 [Eumeta japonica]
MIYTWQSHVVHENGPARAARCFTLTEHRCESTLLSFRHPPPNQEVGNSLVTLLGFSVAQQNPYLLQARRKELRSKNFQKCSKKFKFNIGSRLELRRHQGQEKEYNTMHETVAVKLVMKASQWHKIGGWGRTSKGRGALNLRITAFAGDSDRRSSVGCTEISVIYLFRILRGGNDEWKNTFYRFGEMPNTWDLEVCQSFANSDGEPIKLPENLESLPRAEHFAAQRHRWNTNEACMSIGGGLWLLVEMLSSPFDHCVAAFHLTRLCPHLSVVFNTPYTLVDVIVCNFLKNEDVLIWHETNLGVRYLSILSNQYSILWIEIRSGEADWRVSGIHNKDISDNNSSDVTALVIDKIRARTAPGRRGGRCSAKFSTFGLRPKGEAKYVPNIQYYCIKLWLIRFLKTNHATFPEPRRKRQPPLLDVLTNAMTIPISRFQSNLSNAVRLSCRLLNVEQWEELCRKLLQFNS